MQSSFNVEAVPKQSRQIVSGLFLFVGTGNTGFTGKLYGQNHFIRKVTFTNVASNGRNASGCFGFINGGTVTDIGFESTVKCTAATTNLSVGILAGCAKSATVINISAKNISLDITGTPNHTTASASFLDLGGLIGRSWVKVDMYKCVFTGSLHLTATTSNTYDNVCKMGGMMGTFVCDGTNTTFNAEDCYVNVSILFTNGGPNGGAFLGSTSPAYHYTGSGSGYIYANRALIGNYKNIVAISTVTYDGTCNTPDPYAFIGWPGSSTTETYDNVYIASNVGVYSDGTAITATNSYVCTGSTSNGNSSFTNLTYTDQASATSAVIAKAKTAQSSGAMSNFIIDGTSVKVAGEPGTQYRVNYAGLSGTGVSWPFQVSAQKIYSVSSAASPVPALRAANNPSRPGFNFKGWSLNADGSLLVSDPEKAIPAGKTGDIRKR